MKKLVSTAGMDRDTWLRYRKKGITGTDAAAICGLSPWRSAFEVYQDKTGDEIEESDSEAMRQGRDLEAYVASRFCEETGKKIRRANAIYYNEEHPILLADFDRLIVGEPAGLECKTVNAFSADKWKDGQVPIQYQLQVQHYLAVSGLERWYIAAVILGIGFVVRTIERDEELIRDLITIEERFWKEHVLAGVIPAPDGSKGYSEMLNRLYPRAERELPVPLTGCEEQLKRRLEIESLIRKLSTEKDAIDQSLKNILKESREGVAEGFRVLWSDVTSQRVDTTKLKTLYREQYQDCLQETHSRRFIVKTA